jgi:hypothetical protein
MSGAEVGKWEKYRNSDDGKLKPGSERKSGA